MNRLPVFYFTRMLPAYRIPIMERLNDRLQNRLIVCHGQPPTNSSLLIREIDGNFRHEPLKNYWFRGETLHLQPFKHVFDKYGSPSVVLAEESPRSITLPWLLHMARRKGAGRVLWGIFYSVFRPFSALHPIQRYRILLANYADACACYTRGVKELLAPHVSPEKLFVAQNTVDTAKLFAARENLAEEGKQSVRKRLGLASDGSIVVFSGQLIPRKGTDELLDVFQRLQQHRKASLLVIGDGPERQSMKTRIRRDQINNVHFLGSMPKLEDSAPYLFASDVMLIPGYVGLVVNHAFAMGLPVITTKAPERMPFHGPEVESIVHGKNGFLVQRGSNDYLLDALELVLENPTSYADDALSYARRHLTVEHMVDGLEAAINHANKVRRE